MLMWRVCHYEGCDFLEKLSVVSFYEGVQCDEYNRSFQMELISLLSELNGSCFSEIFAFKCAHIIF